MSVNATCANAMRSAVQVLARAARSLASSMGARMSVNTVGNAPVPHVRPDFVSAETCTPQGVGPKKVSSIGLRDTRIVAAITPFHAACHVPR